MAKKPSAEGDPSAWTQVKVTMRIKSKRRAIARAAKRGLDLSTWCREIIERELDDPREH